MTRAPKPTRPGVETASSATDAGEAEIVQVKVWLLGISPMVWRRVLVASTCTLHERTLDGTLRPLFERWYPGLANDNGNKAAQAAAA